MTREAEIYRSVIELRQDSDSDAQAVGKIVEWLRCSHDNAQSLLRKAMAYEAKQEQDDRMTTGHA